MRAVTAWSPAPIMAAGDTPITISGNLVDDPQLRFTASGQAATSFRVASTPRYYDKAANEWKDGDPLFLTCNIWRQAAENTAESLQRGTRVIVTGRLRQRSYETREGERRTVYEIEADDIGPSLRYATARPVKTTRETTRERPNGSGAADTLWSAAPADTGAAVGTGGNPPF